MDPSAAAVPSKKKRPMALSVPGSVAHDSGNIQQIVSSFGSQDAIAPPPSLASSASSVSSSSSSHSSASSMTSPGVIVIPSASSSTPSIIPIPIPISSSNPPPVIIPLSSIPGHPQDIGEDPALLRSLSTLSMQNNVGSPAPQAPFRLSGSSASSSSSSSSGSASTFIGTFVGGDRLRVSLSDFSTVRIEGWGQFGIVKQVVHVPSGKVFALKSIRGSHPDAVSNFKKLQTELEALFSCDHKNIIKYYDAFYQEDRVHIILEYMNRGSLEDVLTMVKEFPEEAIGQIAYQLLKGLYYLHKGRKIMHRDFKPGNCLINSNGEVKLADFGESAKLTESVSKVQSMVGSIQYMAPERFSEKKYSYPADIWSFGVAMAKLALGGNPYKSCSSVFHMMMEVLDKPTVILNPEKFSPDFVDFIRICTAKDPVNRPSAKDALKHPFIERCHHSESFKLVDWINSIPPHVPKQF